MRKTSQDGGDSTSITSGYENEIKKTSVGIIKTKRNSIKRKVQSFSHESDDTVIEPLLQIDKNETVSRSAKYLLSKTKTESISEKESDIYSDKCEKTAVCKSICTTGSTASSSNISKTLHNHMNTNVFGVQEGIKDSSVKCPLLVEINGCRPVINCNQTSSIFTTAKITANSITKNMEPIQVTPVPILSTIEGNIVKKGTSPDYGQGKTITSPSSDLLNSSTKDNLANKHQFIKTSETQPGSSKSDHNKSSTADNYNKMISSTIESRSVSVNVATGSDSKVISKLSDTRNVNVPLIASTTDSVKDRTVEPAVVTTMGKKCTLNQKPSYVDGVTNIQSQKKDPDTKTLSECDNISVSKLTSKTNTSQDINTTKKESASGIGTSKQLQRQKNTILEDPRDSENVVKTTKKSDEIFELSKSQTSSSVISTSKSDPITNKQLSTSTSQVSKPEITQESASKSIVTCPSSQSASLLKKDLSLEKTSNISTMQIKKSDYGISFPTAAAKKEVVPKLDLNNQPTQPKILPKIDSDFEKKSSVGQNDKSKMKESLKSVVTTQGGVPSTSDSRQVTKPTALVKCDPKNDSDKKVVGAHQTSKSETKNSKELPTSSVTKTTSTKSANKPVAAVITETSKVTSVPKLSSTVTAYSKTDTKDTRTSEIPKPLKPTIATTVTDKPTKMKTEPKSKPSAESTNAPTASSITDSKPITSIPVKTKQDVLISEKQKPTTPQPVTTVLSSSESQNVISKVSSLDKHGQI